MEMENDFDCCDCSAGSCEFCDGLCCGDECVYCGGAEDVPLTEEERAEHARRFDEFHEWLTENGYTGVVSLLEPGFSTSDDATVNCMVLGDACDIADALVAPIQCADEDSAECLSVYTLCLANVGKDVYDSVHNIINVGKGKRHGNRPHKRNSKRKK